MAEVRVKIGADVKDLQKGVQTAETELRDLAKTAQRAAGSTDDLAASTRGIVSGMGGAARASSGARVALTDLNRVVSDAPFGFVAIQNNIDQLAGSFGSLVRESGGVKNALKAIATSFAGPAGILSLISLAGSAAIIFGDQISAAFNKGAAEAERAQQAIKDAFDEVAKFDSISGVSFNETSARAAIPGAKERLSLEQATSEAIQKQIIDIDRQISKTNQLGAAQSAIAANQEESLSAQRNALLDQLQAQTLNVVAAQRAVDGLEAQNAAYGAQNQTQRILVDLGGTLETQAEERVKQLRGQTDEAKAQAAAIADAAREQEQLNKLRARAFAAVGAPTPFVQRGSTPQAAAPLPGQPDRVFDETAATAAGNFAFSLKEIDNILGAGLINGLEAANEQFAVMRSRLFEMAAQGLKNTEAYKQLNAEFLKLSEQLQAFNDAAFATDVFSNLAVDGLEAVVNVKLGFTDAAAAVDSLRQTVQGLIGDLARAALKAAILSGISKALGIATGGASIGFGTLLRGALGIGAVGQASPLSQSIINAPAAVAPLGRLAQASQSAHVVIPELTIRGNDLVVAFQRARAGSARTLGNIPLK